MTADAFERRRTVRQRFMGPVSVSPWSAGYDNWSRLMNDGYSIRVFLNEREIADVLAADPDAGTVTDGRGTFKGDVEVRLERSRE